MYKSAINCSAQKKEDKHKANFIKKKIACLF